MPSSKTYLVPVDFSQTSEAALNYAIGMARRKGGKLLLLHVISDSSVMMSAYGGGSAEIMLELQRSMEESAGKEMRRLVARKRLRPGQYRSVVSRGSPAQIIVREAKKARAQMIIMGSHGRTGLQRLMIGSVAEQALRYAQCPVLIVK